MWVTRLLRKCIVEHEGDCKITDSTELLIEVDRTIEAVQYGGQVLRRIDGFALRCHVCGLGEFHVKLPSEFEPVVLYCQACGYEYRFTDVKGRQGWE